MDKRVKYGLLGALGAFASIVFYKTVKDINRENKQLQEVLDRFKKEETK